LTSKSINEELPDERPDDQLAFSRIKNEIETQAKAKAEVFLEKANEEAEEILNTAKDKANRIKQEIIQQATNEAINTKVRETSRRKLSLKMDYLETREQLIDEIQLEVKSKLQKFSQGPEYSEFLTKLVKQSCLSIGGGKLNLFMRAEDKSLFNKESILEISNQISKDSGTATVLTVASEDFKTLGGVKLVREDNKLYVDNTFETRIERNKDPIRVALLDMLS
jgi:V/A-type H+-transporting ATPase subunit E